MRNGDAPAAPVVGAAVALLDRSHGKPRQALDVKSAITLEQLVAASFKTDT